MSEATRKKLTGRTLTVRDPQFVVASASPRRRELLLQLGFRFAVAPVEVDETPNRGEAPVDYVSRIASAKASKGRGCWQGDSRLGALGADTAVTIDGEILGKPRDRADGLAMLARLSGRVHEVWSAVAFCSQAGLDLEIQMSLVTFRKIEEFEREAYWASSEPRDKAGGYGIQGLAAVFVSHLNGSYSGVMGLPLFETTRLLARNGVNPSRLAGAGVL